MIDNSNEILKIHTNDFNNISEISELEEKIKNTTQYINEKYSELKKLRENKDVLEKKLWPDPLT
ncbi:hypothetical protein Rin_00021440 [Candidatus Regiella insecticola 5.15]|uniref:Uncharacterized protein n=1 Tax=Candidatus Regiella insecticola 5.15 TaxID=1005043 RepID=G2H247_9ENTR|nr:hypothetical protein [Candidatus Regiella insecticola]EGY27931.1 hypothetical protein Rin_00021440 [Candidatus Regiella insecticola 5.15]